MASSNDFYQMSFGSDIFNQKNIPTKDHPVRRARLQKETGNILIHASPERESNQIRHAKQVKASSTASDIFLEKSLPSEQSSARKTRKLNNRTQSDIFFTGEENRALQNNPTKVRAPRMNKTNVILGTDQNLDFIVKKNKASKNEYDPNKYYHQESAFSRRMKEFHGLDEKKIQNLNKTFVEQPKPEPEEINLTARERKLREYYNIPRESELKTIPEVIPLSTKNSRNLHFNQAKDPVYNRVEQLKSNIFHDAQKEATNQLPVNYKQKEKEELPPNKPTLPSNPWKAKIDWKDPKNELLFHHEYETNRVEVSALQRKVNDLKDNIGDSAYSEFSVQPPKDLDDETEDTLEIENNLKAVYGSANEAKIKKGMESVAAIQGKEFYEKNLKLKNNSDSACRITCYEIKNIPDFDKFPIGDIMNQFKGKGIHIYDTKSTGSYINGNTNGSLSFKIREGTDDATFSKNFQELTAKLSEEKGIVIEPMKPPSVKKKIENIPATVQWNHQLLNAFVKNRLTEDVTDPPVVKKNKPEKLSKFSEAINLRYKNISTIPKK